MKTEKIKTGTDRTIGTCLFFHSIKFQLIETRLSCSAKVLPVFFTVFLILLSVQQSFAQDELFQKPTVSPDEDQPSEAEKNIAIDPPGVPIPEDIAESMSSSERDDAEQGSSSTKNPNSEQTDPVPTWMPVVKHYKFNQGENFTAAPLPTPYFDVEAFSKEFKQKWAEGAKKIPTAKELEDKIIEQIPEPNLYRCVRDHTDSIAAPEQFPEGLEGENSPFQDMLFLEPKDFPEDAETVYGITTIFVPFVKEQPNIGWGYIQEVGVPCLPFRIRLQAGRVYFDQGLPALKNYSKNPKGEFHPYIKSLYKLEKDR